MTVKELVELLKKQDQELVVAAEGCDCTAMVVGVSVEDEGTLYIRQRCGWFEGRPITTK